MPFLDEQNNGSNTFFRTVISESQRMLYNLLTQNIKPGYIEESLKWQSLMLWEYMEGLNPWAEPIGIGECDNLMGWECLHLVYTFLHGLHEHVICL